jgi:hypothetical protein
MKIKGKYCQHLTSELCHLPYRVDCAVDTASINAVFGGGSKESVGQLRITDEHHLRQQESCYNHKLDSKTSSAVRGSRTNMRDMRFYAGSIHVEIAITSSIMIRTSSHPIPTSFHGTLCMGFARPFCGGTDPSQHHQQHGASFQHADGSRIGARGSRQ